MIYKSIEKPLLYYWASKGGTKNKEYFGLDFKYSLISFILSTEI